MNTLTFDEAKCGEEVCLPRYPFKPSTVVWKNTHERRLGLEFFTPVRSMMPWTAADFEEAGYVRYPKAPA